MGPYRLTKEQREKIGLLGSEWTVLHSEENLIFELIRKQYESLRPGVKRPPELVELDHQQDEISKRKREISAEIIAVEQGESPPKRRPRRRKADVYVEIRDLHIRRLKDRPDEEICRTLDLDLMRPEGLPALGLPENWTKNYHVTSYLAAYKHRKCKSLVQKLISVAKKSH